MDATPPSERVPARALVLSGLALLVPVAGAILVPAELGDYAALLWLTALVPAFLLAYYRGWRGVATALALGMATLSLTQVGVLLVGGSLPDLLLAVVVGYVAISLGIGWLADTLHRDKAVVADMAFTDILTHLPNRRHARVFLENEFAAAERGRLLSVVLFDLDHFKDYNDRFGHPAGDEALRTFADLLGRSTRRMDLSARFGGEEFVSILAGTDTEGALVFSDRIRAELARMRLPTGARLTVSAGVATYHPSMRSPDELLAAADSALYEAKEQGRNRVRLFGHAFLEPARPSADVLDALADEGEGAEYPRAEEEIGKSPPPVTLFPHQLTGFGAGHRVLVVEDDVQVRRLVGNYLAREGFQVTVAGDVPEAMDQLGEEFDVAVVDLRLPGAPGTDVIRALRARWPGTQVLVMTGVRDPAVTAEALAAGAHRYLLKPFGMPELRRALLDALNRRDHGSGHGSAGPDEHGRPGEEAAAIERALMNLREALVLRHPFLQGHAERRAAFAACINDALGTGPNGASLERGCLLADLGHLATPPQLLSTPGPVDEDAWDELRRHPALGRALVEPLLDDGEVLAVVAWHHERWGGGGYPDGLAGQAIPPAARVAAVADALAALTAPRPHRPARSWGEAVAEVTSGAGTHYDPRVVEAVNARVPELSALFRSFAATDDR